MAKQGPDYLDSPTKRGFDIIGSSLLLAGLGLPMAVGAAAVGVSEGRPLFFSQKRLARGGTLIDLVKIRSMVVNAQEIEPRLLSEVDSRITRIGQILRRTNVDEVPQLLAVITGKLSLVCPRPINVLDQERMEYADPKLFADWYSEICQGIKGGMVSPGGLILKQSPVHTPEVHRQRMRADLEFKQSDSLVQDGKTFVNTFGVVGRKILGLSLVSLTATVEEILDTQGDEILNNTPFGPAQAPLSETSELS